MKSLILYIEDDGDIALAVKTVLCRSGFDVVTAADGMAGLEAFESRPPALVLLDIGLPVLDGWAVLERIREVSAVPVMLLTAHGTEADRLRGQRAGADGFLAKPFSNAALLACVLALLRRDEGGELTVPAAIPVL